MTRDELFRFVLNKVAYTHGRDSALYIKTRDKMLCFTDKTWNNLIERYVNDDDEIDYKRLIVSIRERRKY